MDCDNSIPCNYYKNFCLIFLCLYSSSKFAVCCTVEHFREILWEILRYWKRKGQKWIAVHRHCRGRGDKAEEDEGEEEGVEREEGRREGRERDDGAEEAVGGGGEESETRT